MPSDTDIPSYLTVDQADALAAGLHGVPAYLAATADAKARALGTASLRVDRSRRWQGGKADESQPLEFPRRDGSRVILADVATGEPLVPLAVKIAVVYEASSLIDGQRAQAVAAQHDGLASQQIGTAIESYRAPTTSSGLPVLCVDADLIVDIYRLRSGRLL